MTAISRYGVRVIPNTMQRIAELDRRGELVEGPDVSRFETAFADRVGVPHAATASYGRMAFHYLLRAFDLPAGGEVIMPALTFWVMPEMVRQAGLTPVFADVDPVTFNVTPSAIAQAMSPRTVAVVPTHLWGLPCDMDEIVAIARRHRLVVIEDCAHALGATYRGRSVGTFGDAAIFSFQTLKPLTGYGGGMAVMQDPAVAVRVAEMAQAEPLPDRAAVRTALWHGRVMRLATRPDVFTWTLYPLLRATRAIRWNLDVYFWESIRPLAPFPEDYHRRLSNVQAAIALDGLDHLDRWTRAQQANAARMSALLADTPDVRTPRVPADRTHAFYQYCAYVPSRDAVVAQCLRRGVDLETLHVDVCSDLDLFGDSRVAAPGARGTVGTVQIPVYERLTDRDLDRVASVVRDVVGVAAVEAAPATMPT